MNSDNEELQGVDLHTPKLFNDFIFVGDKPTIIADYDSGTITTSLDINIKVTDKSGIEQVKYQKGKLDYEYFQTSGITINEQEKITLDTNGYYTIYAKDKAGIENIKIINITNIDEKPVINLNGFMNAVIIKGTEYIERGATVTDDYTPNLQATITGSVDVNTIGKYEIKYSAQDSNGKNTTVIRNVHVMENPYYVIEVADVLGTGNCSVITELQFLNNDNSTVTYTIPNEYDSVRKGLSRYWSETVWNKTNLYDGNTAYTNQATGEKNATIFNYSTTSGAGAWSRMLIKLNTQQTLSDIRICTCNVNGRLPRKVTMYAVEYNENIYNNNIKTRSDTNLIKMKEINFNSSHIGITTATWF